MKKLHPQTIEEEAEEKRALAVKQEWMSNMETELGVQPGTIPQWKLVYVMEEKAEKAKQTSEEDSEEQPSSQ